MAAQPQNKTSRDGAHDPPADSRRQLPKLRRCPEMPGGSLPIEINRTPAAIT
jgi:hypothetical protein